MSVFSGKTSAVHNEEYDNRPERLSATQRGRNTGTKYGKGLFHGV